MAYTIPEYKREDIRKKLAALNRKAARYSKAVTYTESEPYVEMFPVYDYDEISHTTYIREYIPVEVYDLDIQSDLIRKDGFTTVAKIEHMDNGNFVTALTDETRQDWFSCSPYCQHCKSKRDRKVTFIVQDNNGNMLQVGKSCLKEYSGIDPELIGIYNEIISIDGRDDDRGIISFPEIPMSHRVFDIVNVLAYAIMAINAQGYVKTDRPGNNREYIYDAINKRDIIPEGIKAQAQSIVDGLLSADDLAGDGILSNAASLAKNKYCKATHFGVLAYVPVAWKKYTERKAERDAKTAKFKVSNHVGEVGKRIEVDVKECELLTSFGNFYGTTFLYRFIDLTGNVFIWFASNPFEFSAGKIKAMVKDHTERDGVKQTVLTRCKVIKTEAENVIHESGTFDLNAIMQCMEA